MRDAGCGMRDWGVPARGMCIAYWHGLIKPDKQQKTHIFDIRCSCAFEHFRGRGALMHTAREAPGECEGGRKGS